MQQKLLVAVITLQFNLATKCVGSDELAQLVGAWVGSNGYNQGVTSPPGHPRKSFWLSTPSVNLHTKKVLCHVLTVSSILHKLWGPSISTSEYRIPHWSLRLSSALMMMSTKRHSEWNVKQRRDGKGDRFPGWDGFMLAGKSKPKFGFFFQNTFYFRNHLLVNQGI